MVTYLAKFIQHLTSLTHELKHIIRKDSVWILEENTERDFELINKTVMQVPCLRNFVDKKSITLSVDASKKWNWGYITDEVRRTSSRISICIVVTNLTAICIN